MRHFLTRFSPTQWAWLIASLFGIAPLCASDALPLVDLPQHLHLISVLHRLDDATTLFPEVFERRAQLTPYLGYYYAVSGLNWLLPLETANRLFLAAYVIGLPLSLAFLLRSLKRPTWPALLAWPFAYGDSFAWGFLNYCAAIPLACVTCGLFVRSLEDVERRARWALGLAVSLVVVLLFHVQVFAFLAVALPVLLLMTRLPIAPWRGRVFALLGVLPGVVLFIAWVGLRVGEPAEIAPGQPWKSWGPMLSAENLAWKGFAQNREELIPVLGNMLRDGSDATAPQLSLVIALMVTMAALALRAKALPPLRLVTLATLALVFAMALRWSFGSTHETSVPLLLMSLAGVGLVIALVGSVENLPHFRVWALAGLALALYFALPFDIRGYMYYLNTRYAHLAAALAVICVPVLDQVWRNRAMWLGVVVAFATAWPLYQGFRAFDAESQSLQALALDAAVKPRVMGLVFDPASRVMTHPVYLHASTVVARQRGGLTNFSFALTPHSPLKYRAQPPPTFPSEWDPRPWAHYAGAYDHFVVRGLHPSQVFGSRLDAEFELVSQRGEFFLVRRRPSR